MAPLEEDPDPEVRKQLCTLLDLAETTVARDCLKRLCHDAEPRISRMAQEIVAEGEETYLAEGFPGPFSLCGKVVDRNAVAQWALSLAGLGLVVENRTDLNHVQLVVHLPQADFLPEFFAHILFVPTLTPLMGLTREDGHCWLLVTRRGQRPQGLDERVPVWAAP